jgi:metal-responsive CopG/Arc/MetJ family transcriptional regulator
MKTAISLPDELGHAADLYAAQADMTRSELYARALSEYLSRHKLDNMTEKINKAMDRIGIDAGQQVRESGLSALRSLEW